VECGKQAGRAMWRQGHHRRAVVLSTVEATAKVELSGATAPTDTEAS
jgi:hypothetical protein